MDNIAQLVDEKFQISKCLEQLPYGSVEVRESGGKKYIYAHRRENGVTVTKYIGEFSNELYTIVINNGVLAKDLKKRLRAINKKLLELNHEESELTSEVDINRGLAYRYLADSIYKQSVLEGIAAAYSDIETLVNGGIVSGISARDIGKVINLKRAWEFIIHKGVLQYQSNYVLLCQINELVENGFSVTAGRLRSIPVTIGGSSYIPPLPIESQVKEELIKILEIDNVVERAIKALLYVMKKQLFLDGNKRTAVIFANHILISNGKGLVVIPAEDVAEYKKLLVEYYETDIMENIYEFLLNKALIRL